MTLSNKDIKDEELIPLHYEAKLKWACYIHKEDGTINQAIKDELQEFIDELTAFNPQVPIHDKIYPFTFSVDDDVDIISIKTTIYISLEIYTKAYGDFYNCVFEGRIKDLCFVINLAYPSLLHINGGAIYCNGAPVCSHFKYSSDLFSLADELCLWPSIEELSIEDCWEWILSKTNFLFDISKTPLDRALHALSYSDADEKTYIFYVLLGIEAIYNDGSNKEESILEQLKRKTKALLGEYPLGKEKYLKNQINEMYRMRSLLVHGSTNIQKSWNTFYGPNEDFDRFMDQREPMILATAILLSTIQEFIKANANTITETITVKLE